MRIAMFTNNYKPYIGGVPVSIEHLAEALRERGNVVYVFAPSYAGQQEEEYVIRYPSFPVKIAGAPVPNALTGLIARKVKELEIDIIHVHHPAIVGNVALSLRKKLGIPVVFTYHTRYEEYLHYIKGLELLERHTGVFDKYLKYFCRQCDLLVAPTPGMREYLLQKGSGTPIAVMPTGIPAESYSPDAEKAQELRQKYKGEEDYLFCTVARLASEKNLMFLLDGLAQLKEMLSVCGKSFRHLIIGDGPQKKELIAKINMLGLSENVVLVGNVPNEEIRNYQAASDLFLFTSKSETQGIVLLEAMAVGTPVIAVDATGVRDIVASGKNGFLTLERADAWAARIVYLLGKKQLLGEMRAAAKKTAEQYSEAAVAADAEGYYYRIGNCALCNMRARENAAVPKDTWSIPFFHRYVL